MTHTVYRRPTWVRVKIVNPVLSALVLRTGLGRRGEQNLLRVLRVRGRRSGREYDTPVRIAIRGGTRYVVSLLGEAQWVRNLRAAGTAQLLVGTSAEPVHSYEIGGEEKVAFLEWYCRQPAHRLSVRAGLKVNPVQLTSADISRLVRHHPIFRLDPAGVARSTSHAT
jgi:deazaflavin-dependent oxidoreductase (nitroreductase family)